MCPIMRCINGLDATEADVGPGEVLQAFVTVLVVAMLDASVRPNSEFPKTDLRSETNTKPVKRFQKD